MTHYMYAAASHIGASIVWIDLKCVLETRFRARQIALPPGHGTKRLECLARAWGDLCGNFEIRQGLVETPLITILPSTPNMRPGEVRRAARIRRDDGAAARNDLVDRSAYAIFPCVSQRSGSLKAQCRHNNEGTAKHHGRRMMRWRPQLQGA